MSGFNLADLFEVVVDQAAPDREVLVTSTRRLTYGELDRRANQLANVLAGLGVGAGDHIGLQLVNGTEYVEGMLACFKLSAVPINVNFRYVESELQHLYDDADLVAVIHHRQFSPRVAAVAANTEKVKHLIVVEDGSGETESAGTIRYEDALAAADVARPRKPDRNGDNHYIAYTGGTTGLPKGVVWRQEDIFFAAMGGGDPFQSGNFVTSQDELAERFPEAGITMLTTPPMMHVSAQWGVFHTLFTGGRVVFPPPGSLEPEVVIGLMVDEGVNLLIIVGDAMARPLADAFEAAKAADPDFALGSLLAIGSGGATLSATAKRRLTELFPSAMIIDGFGSSETGVVGGKPYSADDAASAPRFSISDLTQVLDEDNKPVEPGSGRVGRLARKGHVPLGYYKDEGKTKTTFVEIDGARWVLPGDNATVEADGTVVLLGRGSTSINTGGEKVYPEEVEVALLTSSDIADAVVVGVPDDRWGERVVALVKPADGSTPTLEALQTHARTQLAGYKVPRELLLVPAVERTPAGKPDYKWAREYAKANVTP